MRSVVVASSFLLASTAAAMEPPLTEWAQMPGHNPLDCYCRAQGKTFAVGQSICLRTAQGPKLARCRMEINVTSWAISEESCPET